MRRFSRAGWLLLAFAAAWLASCSPAPKFKAVDLSHVEWGGDFELTAHTGSRVKTADFRGRVVVFFFGYTHCPDICAPTLEKLAGLMKRLGDDAARVQVLFVTVDPQHDTVAQLAAFVPKFHPSFVGLTGSEAEIGAVTRDYKVAHQENPQDGTAQVVINHFNGILLKDPRGRLRLLLKDDAPLEDMEHDVRLLLAGK